MKLCETVFLTLEPQFGNYGNPRPVRGFQVSNLTKKRPTKPHGPVIELKLSLPSAAFEPLRPVVEIEVPEGALDYTATVEVVLPEEES